MASVTPSPAYASSATSPPVWIMAKANHTFSQQPGGLTAKAVGDWFGLGKNAAQRAPALLQALDVPGQLP